MCFGRSACNHPTYSGENTRPSGHNRRSKLGTTGFRLLSSAATQEKARLPRILPPDVSNYFVGGFRGRRVKRNIFARRPGQTFVLICPSDCVVAPSRCGQTLDQLSLITGHRQLSAARPRGYPLNHNIFRRIVFLGACSPRRFGRGRMLSTLRCQASSCEPALLVKSHPVLY
jgi:hypothetical protein